MTSIVGACVCVWHTDRPGALHAAMGSFTRAGVNLTKIESHPSILIPFSYDFFVDFNGHESQSSVQEALAGLKAMCRSISVLGSYVQGKLGE